MNRFFSRRQRKILQMLSGNMCEKCGVVLEGEFHADHKTAYSKGGKTILINGQALCPDCNLKKGAKDGSTNS